MVLVSGHYKLLIYDSLFTLVIKRFFVDNNSKIGLLLAK